MSHEENREQKKEKNKSELRNHISTTPLYAYQKVIFIYDKHNILNVRHTFRLNN